MTRNWKLESEERWDDRGTNGGGYRYLSLRNTDPGDSWEVARIWVDEEDHEMLEDAHLIAAAPALKAALERILELCGRSNRADIDTYMAALIAANDAIAKSEGRERQEATQ